MEVRESVEFKIGAVYRGRLRVLIQSEADTQGVSARIYESKGWLSSHFEVVLEGEEIACDNVIDEMEDWFKLIAER